MKYVKIAFSVTAPSRPFWRIARNLGLLAFLFVPALIACDKTPTTTNPICDPGKSQSCNCTNGNVGSQTCATDGLSWAACQCDTKPSTCTLGESRECSCEGGGRGVQACTGNNQWSACSCPSCTPGEKEGCDCTNGDSGSKTCNTDGKGYSSCACVPGGCRENATKGCQCANLESGIQTCKDGKFGACEQCGVVNNKCRAKGDLENCNCPNGATSVRVCQDNLTWGLCKCDDPPCKIGDTEEGICVCPIGIKGKRTCVADARGYPEWGTCECTCKDGEKLECDCPNGTKGQRSCDCTGGKCEWAACACARCATNADCTKDPKYPHCNSTINLCVTCLDDSHCASSTDGKRCQTFTGNCVGCLEDGDCSGGNACDPSTTSCQMIQKAELEGTLRRCDDASTGAGRCRGSAPTGDSKGPIYFLFYNGTAFPPPQTQRPFYWYKLPETDFSDPKKEVPFKVPAIPPGTWIVYVFIDDNNNWSENRFLPDPGDLVGFLSSVEIKSGQTNSYDFYLVDRY